MDYAELVSESFKIGGGIIVGFAGWSLRMRAYNLVDRRIKAYVNRNERSIAIWQHYQNQGLGHGHSAQSVFECGEEKCRVFGGRVQMV